MKYCVSLIVASVVIIGLSALQGCADQDPAKREKAVLREHFWEGRAKAYADIVRTTSNHPEKPNDPQYNRELQNHLVGDASLWASKDVIDALVEFNKGLAGAQPLKPGYNYNDMLNELSTNVARACQISLRKMVESGDLGTQP